MDIDDICDIFSNNTKLDTYINVLIDYDGIFNEFAITPFNAELPCIGIEERSDVPDILQFQSAAHYIHIAKALMFGDMITAQKIFAAKSLEEICTLSSQISDYDPDVWEPWCDEVYLEAMRQKIRINSPLYYKLLSTDEQTIVEPRDPKNNCGNALTKLREEFNNVLYNERWHG